MRRPLIALLVLAACGDSTGPEQFPLVEGVYDYTATINDIPDGLFSGQIRITDDSRATTEFTGTFNIVLTFGSATPVPLSGAIVNGRVSRNGAISFDFGQAAHHHTGEIDGERITGTYVVVGGSSSFDGEFSAHRR